MSAGLRRFLVFAVSVSCLAARKLNWKLKDSLMLRRTWLHCNFFRSLSDDVWSEILTILKHVTLSCILFMFPWPVWHPEIIFFAKRSLNAPPMLLCRYFRNWRCCNQALKKLFRVYMRNITSCLPPAWSRRCSHTRETEHNVKYYHISTSMLTEVYMFYWNSFSWFKCYCPLFLERSIIHFFRPPKQRKI